MEAIPTLILAMKSNNTSYVLLRQVYSQREDYICNEHEITCSEYFFDKVKTECPITCYFERVGQCYFVEHCDEETIGLYVCINNPTPLIISENEYNSLQKVAYGAEPLTTEMRELVLKLLRHTHRYGDSE